MFAQQDIGMILIMFVLIVTMIVRLVTDLQIKIVYSVKLESNIGLMVNVLMNAQMVITETNMQHVNHVQIIVKLVSEHLQQNVLIVRLDSMLNTTIQLSVRPLVMLDIIQIMKQRLVKNVMTLVLVVALKEQINVLVVTESVAYLKANVLQNAQMVITKRITFAQHAILSVKLVMEALT